MSVINLKGADKVGAFKFQNYQERRVSTIRKVLLEHVSVFEDAGWAFDAIRFATWLEGTRSCVSSVKTNADFYLVPFKPVRESGEIDFNDHDSIVSVALACVEEELDAFYGEYDSEAEFAEELYCSTGDVSEDFPLFFAIDWQKVWDCSLRFDFDSQTVIDDDGKAKQYFWRNV